MIARRLSAATKTIQTENNLLLLQFLSIGGIVASRKEWAKGALDWLKAAGRSDYFSNLMTATHSVDGRCLTVLRVGSRDQISITEFGRKVLELGQPVWIRGGGWFAGVSDEFEVRVSEVAPRELHARID
ncbi:MAG: hypothetical protein IPK27_05720 [Rhodanobacteraceae bacterium]|nr:hypothetical protein [Rhodanobacteraceae bacterium]